MSASFKDIDPRNVEHGLNAEQLNLAKRLEEIADIEQKKILERMGVKGITRYTHIITAKNYAQKQKSIIIKHLIDNSNPEGGGWYFYENDKLKVRLSHPFINDGRISMKVQEFL